MGRSCLHILVTGDVAAVYCKGSFSGCEPHTILGEASCGDAQTWDAEGQLGGSVTLLRAGIVLYNETVNSVDGNNWSC